MKKTMAGSMAIKDFSVRLFFATICKKLLCIKRKTVCRIHELRILGVGGYGWLSVKVKKPKKKIGTVSIG